METRTKVILTTVVFTFVGLLLSPQAPIGGMIWPAQDHEAVFGAPTSTQIGLLMFYTLLASIGFGLGVAFFAFGAPLVMRQTGGSRALARMAHLAVTWLLVSWVPHDSLHQHISSIGALIALEFGFHLTLIISGIVLARFFLSVAGSRGAAAPGTDVAGGASALIVGK